MAVHSASAPASRDTAMPKCSRQTRFALAVAGLLAVLTLAQAQTPDCSSHGTKDEAGQCQCSQPLPDATAGTSGWVGKDCELEVSSIPTNGAGTDVNLEPGQTKCWTASLWGSQQTPNYFVASVTLAAGVQGSLSLYGLLAADPSQTTPGGPAPIIYPHTVPGDGRWDYLLQAGPATTSHAVLKLTGPAAQAVAIQAIYLCASNPADAPALAFTLRAAGHSCPLTLHDDGFISICSSTPEDVRYSSDVCPTGVCACVGAYSRPAAPVDTGLGFESCSAVVDALPAPPGPGQPTTATVNNQPTSTWHFFNLTIAPEDKHWALSASVTAATTSRMALHVRPMQPPGTSTGTFAARTDWSDFSGDLAVSLMIGPGLDTPTLTPGVWFVGVFVFGEQPVSYTLTERRSVCAGLTEDCSGRGTCDAATGQCTCNEGASGADCSLGSASLSPGAAPLTMAPRSFAHDTVRVPGLKDLLTLPTVRLNLKATFTVKDPLPAWVTARPLLLVAPAGDDGSTPPPAPTPDTATWRLTLPDPDKESVLTLSGAQLSGVGQLQAVLWNPLSSPYQVGYTFAVEVAAQCLDDCSGHGRCDSTGRCSCDDGWLGASCSVDASAFSNSTQPQCSAGSRVPVRKEDLRATCWIPCDPDTGKYDESQCIDFTCDPTAADGRPQRRAGSQQQCVVDLCNPAAGNVVNTDVSGNFVCEHQCVCPEDGGLCAADTACLPNTIKCLNGLVPMPTPDGTTQCVAQPSPGVCEEGSLRLAIALDGGSAYAVCVCNAQPPALAHTASQRRRRQLSGHSGSGNGGVRAQVRDGTQCAWTSVSAGEVEAAGGKVDPSKGVVMCVSGYQVVDEVPQGLPLSDGRVLTSGGRCAPVQARKRGTSGGMVFFWCIFSLTLAAGLVVGGRLAYEWYEARRWDLGGADEGPGVFHYVKLGMENLFNRNRGGGGGDGGSTLSSSHW